MIVNDHIQGLEKRIIQLIERGHTKEGACKIVGITIEELNEYESSNSDFWLSLARASIDVDGTRAMSILKIKQNSLIDVDRAIKSGNRLVKDTKRKWITLAKELDRSIHEIPLVDYKQHLQFEIEDLKKGITQSTGTDSLKKDDLKELLKGEYVFHSDKTFHAFTTLLGHTGLSYESTVATSKKKGSGHVGKVTILDK
ncbi:hypothetical protein VCHA53O463_110125 [Vibrio chagasii]|nr:hypothetical protein VCHA35P150_20428 [Vibrio chagasii]CAH6905267.1 hypothetical protein VCHA56P515_100037 [Vibrio chagasii]CAH6970140.1 hypothetical protein VCHA53O463_110125 [Vibrio chagasii]CAH7048864.1 hypothetical protein VCHA36P166_50178 [Vibrio chagasii]CAH7387296.1 hypothetical protein VCHA53O464_20040 [Vibrio chagasii]